MRWVRQVVRMVQIGSAHKIFSENLKGRPFEDLGTDESDMEWKGTGCFHLKPAIFLDFAVQAGRF